MAPESANGAGGLAASPIRTIIAPMRNEGRTSSTSSTTSRRRTSTGEVEVLVADGGSTDGSVERLARRRRGAPGLELKVLDNPRGWVSPG